MNRLRISPLALVATLALSLAALGATGCAKKLPLDPLTWGLVPYPQGTRPIPDDVRDIAVSGTVAYLADGLSGLKLLDVSHPASPALLGSYDTPGDAQGVAVSGKVAYVADGPSGLLIVSVSNPASPVLLGSYDTPGDARDVAVSGTVAFVADGSSGLQIVDVSNPASPAPLGRYDTPDAALGVTVSGTVAYVADGYAGLQTVDVGNPASPAALGSRDTPGLARSVAVSGPVAYVADGAPGLQIFNVTNPATPTIFRTYNTPGAALGVTISGTVAYVADGSSGLQILDVANLASPALLGSHDTPGGASNVVVSGPVAYVADGFSGLQIVEVSNPAAPILLGSYNKFERATSDLVVWEDLPNDVLVDYADANVPDYDSLYYRVQEGAIVGSVFDYFGASGYQMFRRESGGGFRQFVDFTLTPARRWPDRTYFGTPQGAAVQPPAQLFTFSDAAPPPVGVPGYVGRAVVGGLSSASYPLTNLGEVRGGIDLIGVSFTSDSLMEVLWDPVPGASGYWMHVYQPRNDIRTSREAIETGLPAPVAIGKVRDLFIGYFPATETGYKLGNALPVGARVLVYRVLQANTVVRLRVSAVNSAGQLISTIGVNGDFDRFLEEGTAGGDRTLYFPLGAVKVEILRAPPPPPGPRARLGVSAIESGVPGLSYVRRAPAGSFRASR